MTHCVFSPLRSEESREKKEITGERSFYTVGDGFMKMRFGESRERKTKDEERMSFRGREADRGGKK